MSEHLSQIFKHEPKLFGDFFFLIPVTFQYRGHRSCHHSKLQPISEVGCNPGGCIIPNCLSKTVKTLPLSKSSPFK